MQFKSYMHGLCDYFLLYENFAVVGIQSVCSKEVQDMFYVFYVFS